LQRIEEKATLILKATVTGKPEPTVKWFRDDTELAKSFKLKTSKTGDVVSLSLSGATTKQSGVYRCVAENRAGSAVCEAPVTIAEKMEPPKFTQKPMNKDLKEGAKAVFAATAKGKPAPEITWYRGEVEDANKIEPGERMKIETKEVRGDVQSTLTIEPAEIPDSCDALQAVATNPAGSDTCSAKLSVQSECQRAGAGGRGRGLSAPGNYRLGAYLWLPE
jgi:hypothetical protein